MPTAMSVPVDVALRHAEEIKLGWRAGADPDAAAALSRHGSLAAFKSVVIDLAYEEYCLREQAGDAPDPVPFCDRFPRHRSSLRRVLDAHRLVTDRPDLLAPAPVGWPAVGSRFESLDVMGELGRGAFGRAYLAFDPETERPCVLKLSAGRSMEARVIGSLRHPHVTDVYWAHPVGPLTAVCMPLVGITTLDDVRESAFPGPPDSAGAILDAIEPVSGPTPAGPPVVRRGDTYAVGIGAIAGRVADALQYLHERGTSHGDLKPSNVVVGPGGHPYLIDFNLSASVGGTEDRIGGTLPYMSPEQLRRLIGDRDQSIEPAKADVYSFGVLIFELLAGRLPFILPAGHDPRVTANALLDRLAEADHDSAALPAGTPERLVRVIRRCLDPDPGCRPSAGEVSRELDEFLRGARGARRPRRWVRAAVFLLCGVAVAGGVGWAAGRRPAADSDRQAVTSPTGKVPETADEFFARGRQFLREDQLPSAMSDLTSANRLKKDPRALEYMAYCAARMSQHENAIAFGRDAVRNGASSPTVHNNLGYSLLKNGQSKLALSALDEAIDLLPNLQAARYNRALARHQVAIEQGKPGSDPGAATDMEWTLAGEQVSAQLFHDAASVFAAGTDRDPGLRPKALRCLAEAVNLGKDPATFGRSPLFKTLASDPEFHRVIATKPGPALPPVNLRLIEPDTR